jgi:hypothetical protein
MYNTQRTVFVQINVVIQGAGAQGNGGTLIEDKWAILRGAWRAHIRGGRAHFRGEGLTPRDPLTLSPRFKATRMVLMLN